MKVLDDFRRAVGALDRIASAISAATRNAQQNGLPLERLMELERTRALWEADVEALLMKAEGKLKAASNAEARERTMKKSYETDFDPFDFDSEEEGSPISADDAEVGYPEEVLPLHMGLAAESKKALALRYKFS